MELVFVPVEVLLHASQPIKHDHKPSTLQEALYHVIERVSKRSGKNPKFTSVPQPPWISTTSHVQTGLCRRSCRFLRYSSNIFFLPPGPLTNTHHGVETLQPQHRAMIGTMGIMMTLQDLTPSVLEEDVHPAMRVRYKSTVMARPNLSQAIRWSE